MESSEKKVAQKHGKITEEENKDTKMAPVAKKRAPVASRKQDRHEDDDWEQQKMAAARPKENQDTKMAPVAKQRAPVARKQYRHEDDWKQQKMAAARPKDEGDIPHPKFAHDYEMDEEKNVERQARKAAAAAKRPARSLMERLEQQDGGVHKAVPLEDGKMPARETRSVEEVEEDDDDVGPLLPTTRASVSSSRRSQPRPPQDSSLPGAYFVAGLDPPGEEDDETLYVGDEYNVSPYDGSTAQASLADPNTSEAAIDAHLADAVRDAQDHGELFQFIGELEDRQQDAPHVDVMPPEEQKVWWKRPVTKLGACLVSIIVLVAVTVGSVLGTQKLRAPDPTPAPTTVERNVTLTPAPTDLPLAPPSMSPTSEEFDRLKVWMSEQSYDDGAALDNPSSPQYEALVWLYNNRNYSEYADTQRIQRYAMATLYFSTGGAGWLQQDKWLSDEPECDWFNKGVTFCDAVSSGVSNFDLNENNLVGKIPPEIGFLGDSVVSLVFSGNTLTGSIPTELGLMTKLTSLNQFGLNLSGNQFKGPIPTELGRIGGAGVVNLSGNNITGSIISEFGQLRFVNELNLGTNNMTGPVPEELYNMKSLTTLHIHDNEFSGTISTNVGRLTNLLDLNFDINWLQGPIPSEFGLLTKLTSLKIDSNRLTSTVPMELAQMSRLSVLWLHNNSLTPPFQCPPKDVINDCRVSCGSFFNDACRTFS